MARRSVSELANDAAHVEINLTSYRLISSQSPNHSEHSSKTHGPCVGQVDTRLGHFGHQTTLKSHKMAKVSRHGGAFLMFGGVLRHFLWRRLSKPVQLPDKSRVLPSCTLDSATVQAPVQRLQGVSKEVSWTVPCELVHPLGHPTDSLIIAACPPLGNTRFQMATLPP
jgi:hypothetical protein